jgi:hypothetical protein
MKTTILIAAGALAILGTSAVANTPITDPFTRLDQKTQPAPDQYLGNGDAFAVPYGDRLRLNHPDQMRPMNGPARVPPRMDANGVPDPRI